MSTVHELGVAELGRALAAREVSSVELTTHFLGRLDAHRELGAVLASDAEAALLPQLNGFFSIVEQMSAVDTSGV